MQTINFKLGEVKEIGKKVWITIFVISGQLNRANRVLNFINLVNLGCFITKGTTTANFKDVSKQG